jgi:hypothetical protein
MRFGNRKRGGYRAHVTLEGLREPFLLARPPFQAKKAPRKNGAAPPLPSVRSRYIFLRHDESQPFRSEVANNSNGVETSFPG